MKTRDLTKIPICVAIIIVCSYIIIPLPFTPASITAQTLALNLTALILTPKQSFTAVLIYILLGVCGAPVFVGGTTGLSRLAGPTGGFILGFLIMAPLVSYLKGRNNDIKRYFMVTILVGMPVIYLFGLVQMCFVMKIGVAQAFMMAVAPFIVGDLLKSVAGSLLANRLNKVSFIRTAEA